MGADTDVAVRRPLVHPASEWSVVRSVHWPLSSAIPCAIILPDVAVLPLAGSPCSVLAFRRDADSWMHSGWDAVRSVKTAIVMGLFARGITWRPFGYMRSQPLSVDPLSFRLNGLGLLSKAQPVSSLYGSASLLDVLYLPVVLVTGIYQWHLSL